MANGKNDIKRKRETSQQQISSAITETRKLNG